MPYDVGPEKQMTVADWEASIRTSPSRHKRAISYALTRLIRGKGISSSMHNLLEAAINTGDIGATTSPTSCSCMAHCAGVSTTGHGTSRRRGCMVYT